MAAGGKGLTGRGHLPLPASRPPSPPRAVKQSQGFLFKLLASGAIMGKKGRRALLSAKIH